MATHNLLQRRLRICHQPARQLFTGKYNGFTATTEEEGPDTKGPNKSCGQPIRPLGNDKGALINDIRQMTYWNGSGKDIAQGLVWGWRVLSHSEPFSEGVPYTDDETLKAIVLLSDGGNKVVHQSNNLNYSDYNSYNYLSHDRLDTTHHLTAAARIDDKMEYICDQVKDKDIRIYTILFDRNSQDVQTLFRDCASSPDMYFENPSPNELEAVFEEIAYDLSKLRLEK